MICTIWQVGFLMWGKNSFLKFLLLCRADSSWESQTNQCILWLYWDKKEKASSRQKINDLTYFRIHLEAKCWKFKNKTNVLVFSVLEGKKIINHKHFQIGTFEIYLYWRPGLVFISQVKWSNNSQCVTQDNILRAQTTFMDLKDVKRSL